MHGKGIFYISENLRYEGDFQNNIIKGKGIIYKSDETKSCEGEFVNGLMHGDCILYHPDGSRYEGDFVNGLKEGKGVQYFSDGLCYEGDFTNNIVKGKETKQKYGNSRWPWISCYQSIGSNPQQIPKIIDMHGITE